MSAPSNPLSIENDSPSKPKTKRCPHINNIKKKIKRFKSVQCEKCHGNGAADDALVFCLTCFKMNCARDTKHMHALNHWSNNKKHNLCISIPSFDEFNNYTKDIILEMLSIWCYKCDCFLSETGQHDTPKLRQMKYEIYGCLQRSYKKLNAIKNPKNKKQNAYSPKNNYKNKNKNTKYDKQDDHDVSAAKLMKWTQINPHFITKIPNDKENGYIGIFGLQNLGNTCFFNSILQNLSETRPLICALTAAQDVIRYNARRIQITDEKDAQKQQKQKQKQKQQTKKKRQRYHNYKGKQEEQNAMDKKLRGRLLTEFHHVITDAFEVVGTNRDCVVPSGLLNAVVARNRRFAGRRQQDSHELMRVLVEGMRDQSEKMLKRDRKNRLQRNLSNWSIDDVMEWCKFYDVDITLDITVEDFSNFIKASADADADADAKSVSEVTRRFFSKIGLTQHEDPSLINKFERGRIFLLNEECDFYCKKHQYDHCKTQKHKQIKTNTIIDDVFGGSIQSMVTCHGCSNVSRTTEEFFDLSLPISNPKVSGYQGYRYRKGRGRKHKKCTETKDNETDAEIRGMERLKGNVDLLDCLAAFTDPEMLSGSDKYGCKYCTRKELETLVKDREEWDEIVSEYVRNKVEEQDKDEIEQIICGGYPLKKHNARKQILIDKPPEVLVLHLKRFEQHGYRLSKVAKKVRFPLHLIIDPYLTEECKEEYTESKCMYQLYGISVHHGSMGGGHYIAYTHKHRNDGPNNGWYYFSDSSYRAVNFEDALKAEAYVLFYQKCDYNPIKEQDTSNENANDVDNDKQ